MVFEYVMVALGAWYPFGFVVAVPDLISKSASYLTLLRPPEEDKQKIQAFTSVQTNELEMFAKRYGDPYQDEPLLHYLKFGKHLKGASAKQTKRVEESKRLFKFDGNGELKTRKNTSLEFTITIPKPETLN